MNATAQVNDVESMKATAIRFIHAFNDDDWDTVREVVAPDFVFHHPVGGTVQAGPEGMVMAWAGFKVLSPDSWHPIPIMIGDVDHVAVLLPTFGTFTGHGEQAPPPTGGRLDYGMVNMVRFENGKLAEMWFGMDSLVEMQQMGVAPAGPPVELGPTARATLESFSAAVDVDEDDIDSVVAFDEVVVVMGPAQADKSTTERQIEVYRVDDGTATRIYQHRLLTDPPYGGDRSIDTQASRALVEHWVRDVLIGRDHDAIENLVSPHLLIHPTAMPCEARYLGPTGATTWLQEQWAAFGDLSIVDHFVVAQHDIVAVRWTARSTSTGEFMGFSATGDAVEFTGVSMYRMEGERIAEIWDTRDTLGILGQLNPEIGAGGHHHH